MNNKALNLIMFVAGAAIGSVATWKIVKTKYEQIAREEIQSIRDFYAEKEEELMDEYVEELLEEEDMDEYIDSESKRCENFRESLPEHPERVHHMAKKPDIMEYASQIADLGYVSNETRPNNSNIENDKGMEDDNMCEPYVIKPDDFAELDDYETVSLTYYHDGVLADLDDNLIEDVEGAVGRDFARHFGEYEDDAVYIRNDERKCDYEILMDYRKYHVLYPEGR